MMPVAQAAISLIPNVMPTILKFLATKFAGVVNAGIILWTEEDKVTAIFGALWANASSTISIIFPEVGIALTLLDLITDLKKIGTDTLYKVIDSANVSDDFKWQCKFWHEALLLLEDR